MKKTLIALAVAASAAVSGSVMAWDASGDSGPVVLSGLLTPQDNITPWEVAIGPAVTTLNADITKGQKVVHIITENAIPVLGIRIAKAEAFQGQPGITPQINYGGAVDVNKFAASVAPLTLDVKDVHGAKIGTLVAPIFAQSRISIKSKSGKGWQGKYWMYASEPGMAFFGGLPKNAGAVSEADMASSLMPAVEQNYINQGVGDTKPDISRVNGPDGLYSVYYFSAIKPLSTVTITLDSPAQGNEPIVWKADLPITVSYQ
ncbi:fimbrial protein [Salmonella enterica subsp. enterica serovar Aberdeen]|uniref:F4 family fimbrial subunit n=1 Tax=Salmonella enterica TaxID=28901 RepID=UPI00370BB2B0